MTAIKPLNISFEVPGVPVAMQRNRHARAGDKLINYQPEKTGNFRALCGFCASNAYKGTPSENLINCSINFIFPAPKSLKKSQRELIENDKCLPWRVNKDIDNLIKSVLDSVQGIIMRNDNQVVEIYACKLIGKTPKTVIQFTEL